MGVKRVGVGGAGVSLLTSSLTKPKERALLPLGFRSPHIIVIVKSYPIVLSTLNCF